MLCSLQNLKKIYEFISNKTIIILIYFIRDWINCNKKNDKDTNYIFWIIKCKIIEFKNQ